MKNTMNIWIRVVSACVLLLASCAAPEQGESQENANQPSESSSAEAVDFPYDFVNPQSSEELMKMEFPETLDLRNYDLVTPVRLQNPFGTCWGFAAVSAAETSLLGSGLAQADGYDVNTLNLSEKHLAYFVAKELSDPESPQNGEGLHSKEGVSVSERMNIGGLPFMATSTFSSGIGPVLENKDEMFEYKGANEWTEKRMIDGRFRDFSYSGDDDWSLPEDERFRQSYVLKESYILPSPAHTDTAEDTYEYNELGTRAIKAQLMNRRGVMIGFCADTSKPDQDESASKFISRNWAHYSYEVLPANHAVHIVGWDDHYSKDNFLAGHEPPEDGAWLVKNSWGSGECEFPDKGEGSWGIVNEEGVHTGYFWLSYYDQSLSMPEALEFDRVNTQEGYYLDEHDFMPASEVKSYSTEKEMKMANVFEAQLCERLEQVSCQTSAPQTKVTYEVYLLTDEYENPCDGLKVAEETAEYPYGGFHKITLPEPVLIQKGHYYSIVVTEITPEGKYVVNVPADRGSDEFNTWNVGIINERESWLYSEESWNDYANDDLGIRVKEEEDETEMAYDNFPIKGFSIVNEKNLSTRIDGTKNLIMYKDQGKTELKVRFTGDAGVYPDEDAKITWKLTEGGEKIIQLEPSDDGSYARITELDEGSTYIYVTVDGIGTSVVRIDCEKLGVTSIEIKEDADVSYTGEEIRPAVLVANVYAEEIEEGKDYVLSYENNVKCGIAKIRAEGIGAYHDATEEYFPIVPAQAEIKDVTSSSSKVKVTFTDQSESGITGYKARIREKGTKDWKTVKVEAGKTSAEFTKLKKGVTYEVQVCGYIDTSEAAEMYWNIEKEYSGKYSESRTVECR